MRASLMAASLASAPLLQKNAFFIPLARHSFLGEKGLAWNVKQIGAVDQLFRLLLYRCHDLRVAVALAGHSNAADEIEILVAVCVVKVAALTPDCSYGQPAVGGQHVFFSQGNNFFQLSSASPPSGTTMVPIPSFVKISSKIEWSLRPSMMWVLPTPALSAPMQASTFRDHAPCDLALCDELARFSNSERGDQSFRAFQDLHRCLPHL